VLSQRDILFQRNENIKKYVTPEKGDLLFSRANTREMVGATAIVKEDYPSLILPDKLWKIKFRDNVNVFYMKYVLSSKSVRNQFSVVSTGTSGSMYNASIDRSSTSTNRTPKPIRRLCPSSRQIKSCSTNKQRYNSRVINNIYFYCK